MIRIVTNRPSPEFLVQDWFNTRNVHLIIGPSGAGKTTWVSQVIRDWRQGLPILGKASTPKPFCYIALDRGHDEVSFIWNKVGLVEDFPAYYLREQDDWIAKSHWKGIMDDIARLHPDVRVFFLDGITFLTPEGKIIDYAIVARFLLQLGSWCERHNATVFGLGHTTKMKKDQEILQARECAIGSVAWGAYTSSLVKIIQTNPADPNDPFRTINIQPRCAAPQTIEYMFTSDGILELVVEAPKPAIDNAALLQTLESFEPGVEFPGDALTDLMSNLPKRTRYNWVDRLIEEGLLQRVRKGVYCRPMAN